MQSMQGLLINSSTETGLNFEYEEQTAEQRCIPFSMCKNSWVHVNTLVGLQPLAACPNIVLFVHSKGNYITCTLA